MTTFIERVPEFIVNHPFVIGAFVLTVTLVVVLEYQRATRVGKALTPTQATRLQNDEDALVIDVRARKDYESGHVHGAMALPAREIGQSIHQLQKRGSPPIILYDEGGFDAERAAKTLQKNGFERLYVIDGGMPAWRKADMPIRVGSQK